MIDFPRSLFGVSASFCDEGACASYLVTARWPEGLSGLRPRQGMGVGDQDLHLGVESNQQIEKIVVTVERKA